MDRNVSSNNTADGIVLFQSNNNRVRHNRTSNNTIDGIDIDTSNNDFVEHNIACMNGKYGIAIEPTSTGNKVRKNWLGGNGVANLFVGNPNNNISGNHIVTNCNVGDDNDDD